MDPRSVQEVALLRPLPASKGEGGLAGHRTMDRGPPPWAVLAVHSDRQRYEPAVCRLMPRLHFNVAFRRAGPCGEVHPLVLAGMPERSAVRFNMEGLMHQ
eukprot:2296879-Pyramimonas_sp.AAC.1